MTLIGTIQTMDSALNLSQLSKYFSDEDAARELLEQMRWGKDGAVCPHCGGADPYKLTPKATSKKPGRKGLYKCKACRKQFTVTVKTVFEDSRIPISKWLLALHLLASSKKGISAHQLHRNLGISYKAAWFMAHRLRYAMSAGPLGKLMGVVEVDETYVGGKRKFRKGRPGPGDDKKVPVVALVERGGRVRAFPMMRVTSVNLRQAIAQNIDMKKTTMMTDDSNLYSGYQAGPMPHKTVNHSRGEYVRGDVHTNTVEGFFSLLKRGINGTFHHVSKGHLNRYCDEFSFRYSNRHVSDSERSKMVVMQAEGRRLTYKQPDSAI
jgi:transposase-like protein